jgi:hypothetical protein
VFLRSADVEDEMMITRKQLTQDSHTELEPPPSLETCPVTPEHPTRSVEAW